MIPPPSKRQYLQQHLTQSNHKAPKSNLSFFALYGKVKMPSNVFDVSGRYFDVSGLKMHIYICRIISITVVGGVLGLKIAICDDEAADLQHLKELVEACDRSLDITTFSTAKALYEGFQATFYDLIFLDIEMEPPTGYEVACQLMEQQDKPLIVFVTNSSEYTIRGYGVAFRYLPKPITYDVVATVMTAALEQLTPKKIAIQVDGITQLLSLRDIGYIEVRDHRIHYHTAEQEWICRGNLKLVERTVSGAAFSKPHSSFLVNLEQVAYMTDSDVVLTDGTAIPVSKRNKKGFEEALAQFVRRL